MRIVVSLTTLPERVNLLARTLASLRRQTRPPDAIYLWCPAERFGGIAACPRIAGVEARLTPDLGPATKLLPCLAVETDPRTRLVVVDDDIEYPADLIEKLGNAARLFPARAIGFTGWSLAASADGPKVIHWNEEVPKAGMFQPVRVLEGYRGVIYRRDFFGDDILAHLNACPAFQCHDDILFSGYLASRHIQAVVSWFGALPTPAESLWRLNGQEIGLHRRPDWYTLGREALHYWARRIPAWLDPVEGPNAKLRLQIGADSQPRPGFLCHEATLADALGPEVPELARTLGPWLWGSFAELLLWDPGRLSAMTPSQWLTESRRLLRPAGVLKVWLPANTADLLTMAPRSDPHPLSPWVHHASRLGWDAIWEAEKGGWVGTLVAGAVGTGRAMDSPQDPGAQDGFIKGALVA